ncbi:hypothetical protein OSTOST_09171, partial [Ostertagia ostertagi]
RVRSAVTDLLSQRFPPKKLYCRKAQEDFSYWDDDNSQSTSSRDSSNSNTPNGRTAQDDLPPIQPPLSLQKSPIFPPKLPQSKPNKFSHHLINEHPWAKHVTVRERPSILSEDCVTSSLPLEVYRHIPDMGYFSYEFVQSLFPRYHQQPNSTQPLPIFELMRLQDAVDFRKHSLKIIDQLKGGTYVARENSDPGMFLPRSASSESPASVDDQLALCKLVRPIIPSHPQEGLLPLKIFDIPRDDRDWIDDRVGRFTNYFKNPRQAHHRMTKLFNVGCSALLAIEGMNDDRSTRRLTATVPSLTAFPIRFHFTLRLDSESGWTANRSVFLWIVGAASVERVSILRTKFDPKEKTLDIQLVSSARLHRSLMLEVNKYSKEIEGTIYIDICVKLARQCVNRTVPVYPMLTKHKLFENITRNSECRGAQVLDAVYNNLSSYKIAGSDYLYRTAKRISLDGKSLELGSDQVAAIRLGCDDRRPIVAIRGPFGSGKTLVAALIAARVVRKQKGFSIITATTNGAVAQITDTVLKLDEYRDLPVLRYVSDTSLIEGNPSTTVDINSILKRLPDDYFEQLSREDLRTCRSFKKGRELLEKYLFTPENGLHLTASEQKEYRLAEQEAAPTALKPSGKGEQHGCRPSFRRQQPTYPENNSIDALSDNQECFRP